MSNNSNTPGQSTPQLRPTEATFPIDFELLRSEAAAEGYRFIERLCDEWNSGSMRYDQPDEKLLLVFIDNQVVGIGGISNDPILPGVLRMRRFYIRPHARGKKIGRMLVTALLKDIAPPRTISVHAGTAVAALFWDAIGFPRTETEGITHIAALNADGILTAVRT